MKTVFDVHYRPGMSQSEYGDLLSAISKERQNDAYSAAHFEMQKNKHRAHIAKIERANMVAEQEKVAYMQRKSELDALRNNGRRVWQEMMREKWGW